MTAMVHTGDCLEVMRKLADASIDACVTDPPYGIRFMGKAWDGKDIEKGYQDRRSCPSKHVDSGPNGGHRSAAAHAGKYDLSPQAMLAFQQFSEDWAIQVFRVLKPGAHVVAFASTRTYHRMVCGLEQAGFEIRDQLAWVFGSGFPKSRNLTDEWQGWGTALKPAWEPIVLARKPLIGTVQSNVDTHGTGALNIDGCRIELGGDYKSKPNGRPSLTSLGDNYQPEQANQPDVVGRWPANFIHDGSDEVLAAFPVTASGAMRREVEAYPGESTVSFLRGRSGPENQHGDSGSAARFFYCAKASRADRNAGCAGFDAKPLNWSSGEQSPGTFQAEGTDRTSPNHHPTVKPTNLMRWLCRLITPPGGTILDPFTGSGSTGRGAVLEGFAFTGIELDPEYVAMANARIAAAQTEAENEKHAAIESARQTRLIA